MGGKGPVLVCSSVPLPSPAPPSPHSSWLGTKHSSSIVSASFSLENGRVTGLTGAVRSVTLGPPVTGQGRVPARGPASLPLTEKSG